MRKAFFVWRGTSTDRPSPAIYFDHPPGPGDRRYGPPVVAEHEITGDLLRVVNESDGGAPWGELARTFPAPIATA